MDTAQRPTDETVTARMARRGISYGEAIRQLRAERHPKPEWRRRSLEGRNRFDAVNDTTDRVVGR